MITPTTLTTSVPSSFVIHQLKIGVQLPWTTWLGRQKVPTPTVRDYRYWLTIFWNEFNPQSFNDNQILANRFGLDHTKDSPPSVSSQSFLDLVNLLFILREDTPLSYPPVYSTWGYSRNIGDTFFMLPFLFSVEIFILDRCGGGRR